MKNQKALSNLLIDNGYNKQFNQSLHDALTDQGYEGQLDEMLYRKLRNEGFSGSYVSMIDQASRENWESLVGFNLTSLMSTLLSGAAQLIAHPLEYGSMFQDRAGTTPVTAPGQLVGHCLDAGGGGYHATAISDAARGVFREVGGIRYIEYNGVNTAYATPALPAPGVDKAQVFAGVRKLVVQGSAGLLVEMSPSVSNNGSFAVFAQIAQDEYFFASKGTIQAVAKIDNSAYDSPITNVLTCLSDISGDAATFVIDGIQVAQSTADQGTGNYNLSGTYPLYYGAREGTLGFFAGRSYATLGPITRFSAANATAAQIEAAEAYYTARVI